MAHCLLAEYETSEALLAAARAMREKGYTRLDAFSPYPLHGSDEALGLKPSRLPYFVVFMGFAGAGGAYLLQYWMSAIDYPINVGGRPEHAPLSFFPITFEMGVLFAALTAVAVLFAYARLPALWHPVFEVEGFERATIDRFFLAVEETDPKYDRKGTQADLETTAPLRVASSRGAEA